MRPYLPAVITLLALASAGCTNTNDHNPDAKVAQNTNIVCERERPTGTRLSRTNCRTKEQVAADREDARKTLRNNPSISPGGL